MKMTVAKARKILQKRMEQERKNDEACELLEIMLRAEGISLNCVTITDETITVSFYEEADEGKIPETFEGFAVKAKIYWSLGAFE